MKRCLLKMKRSEISLARLQREGKKFEIIIDPVKAYAYKNGKIKDITSVVRYKEVFSDARKGEKPPESDLKEFFGTLNFEEIADKILKEGTIQLTEKQRKEMIEGKRRRIIDIISRSYVDPRTGRPHPPLRVELALKEAKVRIDPFKQPEEQVKQIVSQLKRVIPLKTEKKNLVLSIPAKYVGKSYGYLKNSTEIISEKWLNDGSLLVEIRINTALKGEFIAEISKRTLGSVKVSEK